MEKQTNEYDLMIALIEKADIDGILQHTEELIDVYKSMISAINERVD